jgi:hypothetical protein
MPLSSGYLAYANSQSKSTNYCVELELDRCALTYASGLCTAVDRGDGLRCSYTFATCQAKLAFQKTTQKSYFSLYDREPPIISGVRARPYLTKFVDLPQEIDIDAGTTTPRKVKLQFVPDYNQGPTDTDKTVRNTQTGGEFWKSLLQKNPNYASRPLRIYKGFQGLDFTDWHHMAEMKLTGFGIDSEGKANLEGLDILAVLEKNVLPWAVSDNNLILVSGSEYAITSGNISNSLTTFPVTEATELPPLDAWDGDLIIELGTSSGFATDETIGQTYGREFCVVTEISGNTLTVSRGRYGTAPVEHQGVIHYRHIYYAGQENNPTSSEVTEVNPIDVIRNLLRAGGISDSQINEASFTTGKLFYPDNTVKRVITKPKKVKDLLAEIRKITGATLFVNRDNQIELKILGPPLPGQTIESIDETSNIVAKSQELTDDPAKRITRAIIQWAPNAEEPGDDPNNYDRIGGTIDAESEAPVSYGDIVPKFFTDSWTSRDAGHYFVLAVSTRMVNRLKNGERKLTFRVEIKDEGGIEVGDYLQIYTSLDTGLGSAIGEPTGHVYFITSKRFVSSNIVEYEALDTDFQSEQYAYIAPDSITDDYTTASDIEKTYGYFGNASNKVGSSFDEDGYRIY